MTSRGSRNKLNKNYSRSPLSSRLLSNRIVATESTQMHTPKMARLLVALRNANHLVLYALPQFELKVLRSCLGGGCPWTRRSERSGKMQKGVSSSLQALQKGREGRCSLPSVRQGHPTRLLFRSQKGRGEVLCRQGERRED